MGESKKNSSEGDCARECFRCKKLVRGGVDVNIGWICVSCYMKDTTPPAPAPACEHCGGKLESVFDARDGIHQGCKGKTTGGTKHDQGKVPVELLPTQALEEIAKVLDFGRKKYDAWNWSKGFKWSRLLGAAMRHLFAYQRGENKDPESGLSHLAHLGCCVLFLIQHELSGLGEDDRYTGFAAPKEPTEAELDELWDSVPVETAEELLNHNFRNLGLAKRMLWKSRGSK